MSYKIYTTRGFVFETNPQGEANLFVKIFTKDFGLITVIAQGTRLLKSKLRYGIQEMTYGNFSFVRGKEYWRLTSVEKLMSLTGAGVKIGARKVIKSVFNFVDRFIKGEEKSVELFDFLEQFVKFILLDYSKGGDNDSLYKDEYVFAIAQLNILALLGYTTTNELLASCIATDEISIKQAVDNSLSLSIVSIQSEINKIVSETHL